jgi:hypothetical protein
MSCPKEIPNNSQSLGCLIKNLVRQESPTLVIDSANAQAINWKKSAGDAWISRTKSQTAHCARGVEVRVG